MKCSLGPAFGTRGQSSPKRALDLGAHRLFAALTRRTAALADFYRRAIAARLWNLDVDLGGERIEIARSAATGADLFLANETGFPHFAIRDAAFERLSDLAGRSPICGAARSDRRKPRAARPPSNFAIRRGVRSNCRPGFAGAVARAWN